MTDSRKLAGDLMDAASGLRRVSRRRLREGASQPPLRGAQLELLQVVENQPEIGVAAAAKALHLADNSVSMLVNQLVAAGLLTRTCDPDDRRAARLALTDEARSRMSQWRERRTALVAAGLDTLGTDDRDTITAALPALRKLLTELNRPRP